MILVTGATGKLGFFVIQGLLEKGVSKSEIVALARNPEKAEALKELGVAIRKGDYGDPAGLDAALAGVDKVLFVSSSELGARSPGHLNFVAAAKKAGVRHLIYTSAPHADSSPMDLAKDHLVTENAIKASGVPFTFLRNSWYFENYTGNLGGTLASGVLLGAAGSGRYSMAARRDFAGAAVAVLTSDGHVGKIYELGGEPSTSLGELAAEIAKQSGKAITYVALSPEEFEAKLTSFGLPPFIAHLLADSDAAASKGFLEVTTGELPRLLGRPTTSLEEAVREGLAALPPA